MKIKATVKRANGTTDVMTISPDHKAYATYAKAARGDMYTYNKIQKALASGGIELVTIQKDTRGTAWSEDQKRRRPYGCDNSCGFSMSGVCAC